MQKIDLDKMTLELVVRRVVDRSNDDTKLHPDHMIPLAIICVALAISRFAHVISQKKLA